MHHTVLLDKVIKYLDVKKNKKYIDATAGEGNLIKEILKRGGLVLAFEWDPQQKKKLQRKFKNTPNLIIVNENFSQVKYVAKKLNFYPADGVVFDLGLSMNQLLEEKKGFSFKKKEEKLDMRINPHIALTASDILNQTKEKDLAYLFFKYGEENNGQKIARAIVQTRKHKKIKTVGQLIKIIDQVIQRKDEAVYRRVFQALRIKVNNELDNLKKGLEGALTIMHPNGKILVISFHSLESRIIKQFIKKNKLKLITKKVIKGERSSQLRVFGLN